MTSQIEDSEQSLTLWRRAERDRLIALRIGLSADDRATRAEQVILGIEAVLDGRPPGTISFYWPFRGEFDLRGWMTERIGQGWSAALPVVVQKRSPMTFRPWRPGCRMERGIWNIPIPAVGPEVTPDVVIAPLVGFDSRNFRLGYGGGYFDRTLAALSPRPLAIGIGLAETELQTIRPQPWDIPMEAIVTERTIRRIGAPPRRNRRTPWCPGSSLAPGRTGRL